jgi:N-terminal domain of anti-restriction factor ArdC
VFGGPMAEPCVLQTGCRVPQVAKEPRTTRPREDTMTADALKKITTDALDTLAALLDEGRSDQLTALLKTMARFHKYSWHNVCLIASQCPTATRVAGFQTWRTMGRFVRKGEKGIAIMAPIIGRREAESEGDNARTVRGFRAAYVFDVDQTDGDPLPTPIEASGDPGARTALLKTAILEQGIALEYVDELGGALGTSSGGCIRLLNGLSPAMEFTTLVHEHAHELLHRADDRPASRDTRELEAEAVAFVVGGAVGLNTSDASRDYILLYRGDREALSGSLDRIQRAASVILKAVSIGG